MQLLAAVAEAEREVAEVRQLLEEEDTLLLAAVQAMAALWQQLQEVRRLQGGRHLTDVAFSVLQLPLAHGEEAPVQAVSYARTFLTCNKTMVWTSAAGPIDCVVLNNKTCQHSCICLSEYCSCAGLHSNRLLTLLPWCNVLLPILVTGWSNPPAVGHSPTGSRGRVG